MALKGVKQIKLNGLMFAMMLEELLSGPCTAQAIAEFTGMNLLTVQRAIRAMRSRKVLHVAGWERDINGRRVIRVFGLGSGKDVPQPRQTKTENSRAYRQRQSIAHLRGFPAPASGNPFAGLGG